jgi:outer membrane protein
MIFTILAYSLACLYEIRNKKLEMKRTYLIISLLSAFCLLEISGQEKKWTLEECINYALANNIGLKRQKLLTETAEVSLLKSKMDILPNLGVGTDASIQYGRSIDPITNGVTFLQNFTNYYGVTTEITLFKGFTTLNTIAANRFMVKAGLESEKIEKNRLIISIMGQYYQVIYAKGLEDASKMQLDLSEKQLFRIVKMVETGKEALSKQYEIESQVSADKLAYTVAQNTTSQAVTALKQLLQVEPGLQFDIFLPDLKNVLITDNTFNTDSVYKLAAQVLPRLREIEFELAASKKQIAAAKGYIAPSISASGMAFTGYYTLLYDKNANASFSEQMHNNFGQSVMASVRLPIFNNYTTSKNIKLAKIHKNDTELKLEQGKNDLYTEIETACLNYNRGRDEFSAAISNYDFNTTSFKAVEKKFESGLVDVTDYSVAKTKLFKAETESLRTKLQLIVRKLGIQLYSTGEYENLIMN